MQEHSTEKVAEKRVWETPDFVSSETFERLALACTGAPASPPGCAFPPNRQKDPCTVTCVSSS